LLKTPLAKEKKKERERKTVVIVVLKSKELKRLIITRQNSIEQRPYKSGNHIITVFKIAYQKPRNNCNSRNHSKKNV
jgi:hypothetical protein